MNLQTPIGPDLPIGVARQFALNQIDAHVSAEPALVAVFWNEVSGVTPPARPDITVFYCFLRYEGATFTLLEFVSGQTLEEVCVIEDPAACDHLIPVFSRLLDAYEGESVGNGRSPETMANMSALSVGA